MKNYIASLLIFLLISSLITSCSSVKLTDSNYMYEGKAYENFLSGQLQTLLSKKDSLTAISSNDPGYNNAQQEKEETEQKIIITEEKKQAIIDSNNVINLRRDPRPPCPDAGNEECNPDKLKLLVVNLRSGIKKYRIDFLNVQGEIVKTFTSFKSLGDISGLGYTKVDLSGENGPFTYRVRRTDDNDKSITYEGAL